MAFLRYVDDDDDDDDDHGDYVFSLIIFHLGHHAVLGVFAFGGGHWILKKKKSPPSSQNLTYHCLKISEEGEHFD